MTLPAGTKLGPYEILAPLGAGGMGEVYRARDSKLDRDVALKVLPERLAQDAGALERFEREAKAVAALSHPNILAIHDFGRHDGVAFAVMELLQGQTLRERLAEGRLPPRKAVDYAVQIAHGLAAAHEKAIVHRDLKPENVFVTNDGRVKILDFGLAKVAAPQVDETHSPTVGAMTEPGSVMGTVGYMSPEQVRGRPADHRSDIFSFGSILYEMLAGRRAFQGDSAAETMAAIAQKDPPEPDPSDVGFPSGLDRVVRHCLEKNPAERFQSAGDLAFALETALGSSARHEAIAGEGPKASLFAVPRLAAAGLVLAAAAFAAGWFLHGPAARSTSRPLRARFERLTDQPGVERDPNLSPDGKSVVYVASENGNDDIYLLRIGGRNPIDLTADTPEDDDTPVFSPDGNQIAFRSGRQGGGIFVMGATGESVRRLTDFGYNPSWAPDGKQVAVSTGQFGYATDRGSVGAIWAVDLASGAKRAIYEAGDAVQPSWSPHGQRIAFWGLRGQGGQRDIWTVPADGSQVKGTAVAVTEDPALDFGPTWSPDGRFLFFASDRGGTLNLWRVPIEEASGRVLGELEPVTTPSSSSSWPSVSRDGQTLVYASLEFRSTLLRAPFDPDREELTGPAVPVLRSTLPIRDHSFSPDGRWVAFTTGGTREDVCVVGADGSGFRRLTDDVFRDRGPSWSPDGSRLFFYSDRSGGYQIWTIRPDGSGLQQLTHAEGSVNYPAISPDGSRFATPNMKLPQWEVVDSVRGTNIQVVKHEPRAGVLFWPFAWAPDGQSLLGPVVSQASGMGIGLAVYSLVTGRYEEVYQSPVDSFLTAFWLRDGRRLIFRDKRGVSLLDAKSGKVHRLISVGGYSFGRCVGVTADGRSITYTETATEGGVWLMRWESGEAEPKP